MRDDGGGTADVSRPDAPQLLAPLAPEQAPGPADHCPPGRAPPVLGAGARAGGRPLEDADAHWLRPGVSKDFRARRRERLVDDAPVAQEDHAVGPRGELRVVGDHDGRHAALAGGAGSSRMTASPLIESSAPEGSSASSSWRSPTTARAMATRWRSPPDSSSGKCAARSPSPSSSSACHGRRLGLPGRDAVELERQRRRSPPRSGRPAG